METISNFFTQFNFTSTMGILLYWLPLTVCTAGYLFRTAHNYRSDLIKRDEASKQEHDYYKPTDTVGTLIGRGLVSIIPICNLFAAIFNVSPKLFGNFFMIIGRIFDQPLVPKYKKE